MEKPKKLFINGYSIYMQEVPVSDDIPIKEKARIQGEKWKQLSDKKREEYNARYKVYNDQYQKELEQYYKQNPNAKQQEDEQRKKHHIQAKLNKMDPGFILFALLHTYHIKEKHFNRKNLLQFLKDNFNRLNEDERMQFQKKQHSIKGSDAEIMRADFYDLFLK